MVVIIISTNIMSFEVRGLRCLMSLATIFQLYHGGQLYWLGKPEYLEKTTDLTQVTDKTLLHNVVSSTPHHEQHSNSQL